MSGNEQRNRKPCKRIKLKVKLLSTLKQNNTFFLITLASKYIPIVIVIIILGQ